jgi:hypothetical protein
MTPELFIENALAPAMRMLHDNMNSKEAIAFVVAICLQESRLIHRRQLGGGTARGYAQFELNGVYGVLHHRATKEHARALLAQLDYSVESSAGDVWLAIEHNDILAAGLARLNLWWLPQALPARNNPAGAYSQYLQAWAPGAPRRETFDDFFAQAWEIV